MTRLWGNVILCDRPYPENVRRLDHGCLPMINEMNRRGILVDPEYFRQLNDQIIYHRDLTALELESLIGRRINPGSGDQVAKLLFEDLKIQGDRRLPMTASRSRFSTEGDILAVFRNAHPAVKLILDWRQLDKLRSTYTESLPLLRRSDGRVYTRFRTTTTSTGRLSSEDPNLMNIPVRGEWGKKIRYGFVASGSNVLVAVDLSQIEMVWAAHLSRDRNLMRVFEEQRDIHRFTASRIFGVPQEQVDKHRHRLPAKCLNYAVLYGVTPSGLQLQISAALAESGMENTEWDEPACEAMIREWYSVYDGVRVWMEEQVRRMLQYGMVWDAFGRHRWMPGARSSLPRLRAAAAREGVNQPVQASAQGHIKLAMAEVYPMVQYYQSRGKVCWPLLQIHDELLFEVQPDIADEFKQLVETVMRGAVPLDVPVGAEGAVGRSWGELK